MNKLLTHIDSQGYCVQTSANLLVSTSSPPKWTNLNLKTLLKSAWTRKIILTSTLYYFSSLPMVVLKLELKNIQEKIILTLITLSQKKTLLLSSLPMSVLSIQAIQPSFVDLAIFNTNCDFFLATKVYSSWILLN